MNLKTIALVIVAALSLVLTACTGTAEDSADTASSSMTLKPANDTLGLLAAITTKQKPEPFLPVDSTDAKSETVCRTGVSIAVPEGYSLTERLIGKDEMARQFLVENASVPGAEVESSVSGHTQTKADLEAEIQSRAFLSRTGAFAEGATDLRGAQIAWPGADYAYHLSWTQEALGSEGEALMYDVDALFLASEKHQRTAIGFAFVPTGHRGEGEPSRAVQTLRFC